MKTTEFEKNHKITLSVKNAYRAIIRGYAISSLWKAYKNPSIYKIRAWEWCKATCKEDGGCFIWITGVNCSTFTAAYFCSHHKTGERCIVVHTPNNVYWCYVTELEQ